MPGQGQLITGVVVGAGAMYLLDPDCGARRRSLLLQKGAKVSHQVSDRFPAVGALTSGGEGAGLDPQRWSPRIRLILGAAGGLLAVKGLRTRGVGGEMLTALGTALLTRALSGTPPPALVDLGSDATGAIQASGPEAEEPTQPAAAQEVEVTAHASSQRRATKSTKRRRSRQ